MHVFHIFSFNNKLVVVEFMGGTGRGMYCSNHGSFVGTLEKVMGDVLEATMGTSPMGAMGLL